MRTIGYLGSILLLAGFVHGQEQMKMPGPGGPQQGEHSRMQGRTPMADHGPMPRQGGQMPGMGKWWKNSEVVQRVGISEAQVEKIEQIFQDYRLKLIDKHAALEKEEALMEPLIEADQPDETKVVAQIDKVASARANLEKANAQMFLGIRRVMTTEQWKKLQAMTPPHPGPPPPPSGHGPDPSDD